MMLSHVPFQVVYPSDFYDYNQFGSLAPDSDYNLANPSLFESVLIMMIL